MNCLIIDDNQKAAFALQELLEAIPGTFAVHYAVQPYMVRSLLAIEPVDIVFIRPRLWNPFAFERLEKMPVMVFINGNREWITKLPHTTVRYSLKEPYHLVELKHLIKRVEQERFTEPPEYLFLRYDHRFHKTAFKDIELIEKKPFTYVQFYFSYGTKLIAGTMNGWMEQLPKGHFIRVSDTLIIPISELPKIISNTYTYQNRIIPLTYRFAAAARREMENGGEW